MNVNWTIKTAFQQLEQCEYDCQGGPLEGNSAYQWLKHNAEHGPLVEALNRLIAEQEISNNLQALRMMPKDSNMALRIDPEDYILNIARRAGKGESSDGGEA